MEREEMKISITMISRSCLNTTVMIERDSHVFTIFEDRCC